MEKILIEKYIHTGAGYLPFLITDKWQVAQLNYTPEQAIDAIHKMDRHLQTDEVFILVRGTAVLIGAEHTDGKFIFTCEKMQPGITYNIPAHCWHNIAMEKDAEIIIVENNNTHLGDFEYEPLSIGEKETLFHLIRSEVEAARVDRS